MLSAQEAYDGSLLQLHEGVKQDFQEAKRRILFLQGRLAQPLEVQPEAVDFEKAHQQRAMRNVDAKVNDRAATLQIDQDYEHCA